MFCVRYLAENSSLFHISIFTPELMREIEIVSDQLKTTQMGEFQGKLTIKNIWNWSAFKRYY